MSPEEFAAQRAAIAEMLMQQQGHIQPGVPQGLEGTPGPDQADLMAQEAAREQSRTLAGDVGSLALKGVRGGLEASMAFPAGQGAMAATGPVMETARHLFQAKLPALYEKLGPMVGSKAAAEADVDAARGAFNESAEHAAPWFGYKAPMPKDASPGALRDRTMQIEKYRADAEIAAAQRGGAGSAVPAAEGGFAAKGEADAIEAFIKGNKKQIKVDGQRLTKAQQRELIAEYLSQGGRLPEAGPWGRDISTDTIEAITSAARKRKP
jgi:hypothetical protein